MCIKDLYSNDEFPFHIFKAIYNLELAIGVEK